MGSPCLFARQKSLKLGYFYWLHVKNSNPLLTELSRCYLKHTKFYLYSGLFCSAGVLFNSSELGFDFFAFAQ